MTNFEFFGSIGLIILLIVGFVPAIRNFLSVYRLKDGIVPRAQRLFSLVFIGTSIVCMPFFIVLLVYLVVTRSR